MKTVKLVGGGDAERVSDEVAKRRVEAGTHGYCPKSEWKKFHKVHRKVEAKGDRGPEVSHEKNKDEAGRGGKEKAEKKVSKVRQDDVHGALHGKG